jgi:hypothetical protein
VIVTKDRESGWNVKRGGHQLSHPRLQSTAIERGRTEACKDRSDLVVHSRDGRIRRKGSFGNVTPTKDREH